MKALSLIQPWATLIAIVEKEFETRCWRIRHRGPLAIHASKQFPKDCRLLCDTEPFRSVLRRHGLTAADLPLGAVICTANAVACHPVEKLQRLSPQELAFGDFTTGIGRYALQLSSVRTFPDPIPARGSLGLWDWEPPVKLGPGVRRTELPTDESAVTLAGLPTYLGPIYTGMIVLLRGGDRVTVAGLSIAPDHTAFTTEELRGVYTRQHIHPETAAIRQIVPPPSTGYVSTVRGARDVP